MLSKTVWITIGTILLILFVTSTSWVGFVALVSGQFEPKTLPDGPDGPPIPEVLGLGRQFFVMLFHQSDVWNVCRGALAAAIAVVAVGSISSDRLSLNAETVMIALAVALVPLAVLFFHFLDPNQARAFYDGVNQGDDPARKIGEEAFYRGWNAYLVGQAQLLFAHLALFFSVKKQTPDAAKGAK